jgi:nucleoid DNA-binding protein
MSSDTHQRWDLSRRDVLRKAGVGTLVFGAGLVSLPGSAAAMNKAELIEAMASESGLSKADAKRALDSIVGTTTEALKKGDRVALVGFGSFSVSKRRGRGGPTGSRLPVVGFDPCPAFAAGLDLIPGRGDERRNQACPAERTADVVVDAAVIARGTGDGRRGLTVEAAKRALEGFINATTKALATREDVDIEGFGTFSISKRSARTGRNPQTGKEIQIAAKGVVEFKAGAELSKAVN